jgi:hypothetical protein
MRVVGVVKLQSGTTRITAQDRDKAEPLGLRERSRRIYWRSGTR